LPDGRHASSRAPAVVFSPVGDWISSASVHVTEFLLPWSGDYL